MRRAVPHRRRLDGTAMRRMRVPGGGVIERFPVGREIEIIINPDEAVMLAE
jgi:hypothetical protein